MHAVDFVGAMTTGCDYGVSLLHVVRKNNTLSIAYKIKELAAGGRKNLFAVLNKVNSNELAKRLENSLGQKEIVVLWAIPNDPEVFEAGLDSRPIGACQPTQAVQRIFQKLSPNMA